MFAGLPRRDLWLLPLISLATIVLLLAGSEVVTRVVWPEQAFNSCRMTDPQVGYRYRANCASTTKTVEGPWVTNDYNGCGYRSAAPCGPVPTGTRRVALIGASLSEGYMVEYPNSIGARLGADLTQLCDAPVEVQNLGAMGYSGHLLVPRMKEALKLRPDAVVLVQAPFDLEGELGDTVPLPEAKPAAEPPAAAVESLQHRVFETLKSSRTVTVAQHFLFQNPSIYIPLYLRYGDKADFLRPPFSPNWQARLQTFDALMGELADAAHQAGVPFTLAFVPQEAQVALMAGRPVPPGVDPAALSAALRAITARHDVGFVDTSVALRAQPTPERLYYQVDGHLSGRGQPLAASYIAKQLAANPDGPFAECQGTKPTRLGMNP